MPQALTTPAKHPIQAEGFPKSPIPSAASPKAALQIPNFQHAAQHQQTQQPSPYRNTRVQHTLASKKAQKVPILSLS